MSTLTSLQVHELLQAAGPGSAVYLVGAGGCGMSSLAHLLLDIRRRGLTRTPRKKHRRKNDLRAIKAAYAPFTRFQMDVKYLTDLPDYWPQMQALHLPRFQYTLRELSLGAQFLAYSDERRSATGRVLSSTSPRTLRNIYVFGRDGDQWRLAATHSAS